MTTIKTDQETGVQTILNEYGKTVMSDDNIREEKIEEVINDNTNIEDVINKLHDLNCSENFIAGTLLDKFNRFDISASLVEKVIYAENPKLDSALNCINANFNLIEQQISLHRKCGNTTEAGILGGMLDILILSSKEFIELKAKRDSVK